MSSGRSTFGGEQGGMPRNNTANVSFFEIVESKAGFCYNLKQIFRYEKPSQEELLLPLYILLVGLSKYFIVLQYSVV